jgi:hypothetical protein
MCSLKSCFHGAGGSVEAEGAVVDIVRKARERRRVAMREAMVTRLIGRVNQLTMRVYMEAEALELWLLLL